MELAFDDVIVSSASNVDTLPPPNGYDDVHTTIYGTGAPLDVWTDELVMPIPCD